MQQGFKEFLADLSLQLSDKIVCEGCKVVLTWENIMNYHKNLYVEIDDMLNFFDNVYSKIQSKEILNSIRMVEATKSITELVEKNEVMDYEPNKTYTDNKDVVVIFYRDIFYLFDI